MVKKLFLVIGIVFLSNVTGATNYDTFLGDNSPPTIFNFRIDDSEKSRVYFDSDEPLIGSNSNGFTISNKTISNLTINEGSTSNHYFTVSESFSYWDNNTIRYEDGSDLRDTDGNNLLAFTLSYIQNNISEPEANTDRYVTKNASGGGDGTSEDAAWTIEEAFSKANAGMTVWIKAGDYGNKNLVFYNDGTPSNPIKFVGYKNTPGDITSNYWDYGRSWDSSEMPTLTGSSPNTGVAILPMDIHYVVFRNLQITNYSGGIQTLQSYNSHLVFERINGKTFGSEDKSGGSAYACFINFETRNDDPYYWNKQAPYISNDHMKLLDLRSLNVGLTAIGMYGDGNNLIEGCKTYSDRRGWLELQDYHIAFNGHNNIVRNCYAENMNPTHSNQSTHGIGVRGSYNLSSTYNLIEKSEGVNLNEPFYFRNFGSNYNVIKDCVAGNNDNSPNYYKEENTGAVWIWGGSDYNIIERVTSYNTTFGIGFYDNAGGGEDGLDNETAIGKNNIIRNSTFNKTKYAIYTEGGRPGSLLKDNKIINCTFNDSHYFLKNYNTDVQNLEITNCIFTDFKGAPHPYDNGNDISPRGTVISNSNFYGNRNDWHVTGNGNTNVDPEYISQIDLQLSSSSPSEVTEGAKPSPLVPYDINGKYRGNAPSMGAYQFGESTTGSVNVNAGEDKTICIGTEVTLTATGNGNFEWSNGETSSSITISPEETTTYTVTVTNGDNSASDEVVVTVNDGPSVSLGDDIDSCPNNEVTLTAEGNGDFLWSTGDTGSTLTVSPEETTTYTVTATITCGREDLSVTDTLVVNINSDLIVDAGEDITTCAGTEVTLTASGEGEYLWDNGETTKSITVNPNETTIYTVALTQGECTSSDDVTVSITEQPEVTLGDDITICYGNEITLTAEGNGDFIWSTGETTSSITINPTETTEYIVTSSVNCGTETLTVSDTLLVTVTPELVLNVSSDMAFCAVQEVTLTAESNVEVVWNTGETTKSITVTPTETTTYTVTSTLGNCTLVEEVVVTISDQPTVDLGNDISICSGSEVTLTAQGNGAFLWNTGSTENEITVSPTETTVYIVTSSIDCGTELLTVSDTLIVSVTPGVTLSVNDDVTTCSGNEVTLIAEGNGSFLWSTGETSASISVYPSETTTYSVSSGSGNCTLTEEITVFVNDAAEVNLGEDKTICSGEEITLTANGVGDFLWSTGQTTSSIVVNPTETTNYSVTATTNCGDNTISATDNIIVNVAPAITLSVSSDITICSGSEVTLTAEGNGDFLWNTGETTSSINVKPGVTTTYNVTSGTGDCKKTKEITVTVEDLPTINLGDDKSICYGDEVVLSADGNGSFLWSNGSTSNRIRVRPLETTTYSVTLISACGDASITDEITINVGPQLTVDAGDNKTICQGESITLTASGTGNFSWSNGETGQSITVNPNMPTRYWVTSTIDGCSVSDDVFVTVQAAPSVSLGEDITICSGEEITLIAEGSGSFLWNTGATTSSIDVKPSQTTTYSIKSSTNCNSDATDEITVFVNDAVNANAGPDIIIELGDTATLTATGGTSYLWSTGETSASINIQPNSTTVYTVEVSNSEGSCSSKDEVVVTVEDVPLTINSGEETITICKDDELMLQALGSDNYLWNTGELGAAIKVSPEFTTSYTVSAQKNGILETVEVLVIVEDCTANKKEVFNVYPNPTKGVVNINLPSLKEKVFITVVSISGKHVLSKEVKGSKNGIFTEINLSRFAKGIYLLKIVNDNYNETKKVLVI